MALLNLKVFDMFRSYSCPYPSDRAAVMVMSSSSALRLVHSAKVWQDETPSASDLPGAIQTEKVTRESGAGI